MDVDAKVEWMDSDYIIWKVLTIFGLCNPNSVKHPVESQQMGWEMLFPDYIFRNVKYSGLCNPNCISTEAEAICFGWASVLKHVVQNFVLWPVVQTGNSTYNITINDTI